MFINIYIYDLCAHIYLYIYVYIGCRRLQCYWLNWSAQNSGGGCRKTGIRLMHLSVAGSANQVTALPKHELGSVAKSVRRSAPISRHLTGPILRTP